MSTNRRVVVIGAGVIGLQTSVTLLRAGYTVEIVAEHFPGDEHEHYTSPWAGAVWRTHASAEQTEICGWDAETYAHWTAMLKKEGEEGRTGESGIKLVPAVQYWDVSTPEIQNGMSSIWWKDIVSSMTPIPSSSMPAGVHYGVSYNTFVIDVPRYLLHLQSLVLSLGGVTVRSPIPRETGLSGFVSSFASRSTTSSAAPVAFVNATGIASSWLVPDPAVHSVQGQTVLVKGEARRHAARLGKDIMDVNIVIPRPGSGTTVVGSSRSPNNWQAKPSERVSRELLDKAKGLAPELLGEDGEFRVLGPSAGLRPYRKGGPRVEIERYPSGHIVIHEYGHAGAGFQNSVGSANKVLRLLQSL